MKELVTNWIDKVLDKEIPTNIEAFCFNIYELADKEWSMEIVASDEFDIEDEDWACDGKETFGTRENQLAWESDSEWDEVLEDVIAALNEYIKSGKYAEILKERKAVAVGFTDGDLELIHINTSENE